MNLKGNSMLQSLRESSRSPSEIENSFFFFFFLASKWMLRESCTLLTRASFSRWVYSCAPTETQVSSEETKKEKYSATFKSVSQLLRCLLQWVHHASSESKNKQKIVRKKPTAFTTFLRKYLHSWPETHFRRRKSVFWTVPNHFHFSRLSDDLRVTLTDFQIF